MSNMLDTIVPKSDQLNADDLIGGITKTIKITAAKVAKGDQPCSLSYEGDNGKPYKPCLSMRRVLVQLWGKDGNAYVGRSMTLYRDDSVRFGANAVGGIRISHMSDISEEHHLPLTVSKGQKKMFTVKPLVAQRTKADAPPSDPSIFLKAIERVQKSITEAELDEAVKESRTLSKTHNWSKANDQQMKIAIDSQRAAIKQLSEERQPGE